MQPPARHVCQSERPRDIVHEHSGLGYGAWLLRNCSFLVSTGRSRQYVVRGLIGSCVS